MKPHADAGHAASHALSHAYVPMAILALIWGCNWPVLKLGVTEIEALGQPFDPEKHNAVMHIDDENLAENTVAEVFRKGYQMGDRVVRFAMVKVAN